MMRGEDANSVKHEHAVTDRYIDRIGSVITYPLKAIKGVLSPDSMNRNRSDLRSSIKHIDGAFNVAHAKSITNHTLLPPYTSEDYREFEQVWATTLAGLALDKKVEFIIGGGIKPVFDLKRNIKKGLSEQEIKSRLASYDDLLQRLYDIDEHVEFNQRLKVTVLLSKVFGRACLLFDHNSADDTIPTGLKIIHPRHLGQVVLDEVTWKPSRVQINLPYAQGTYYADADDIIYLVNLPYTPVLNSMWYGFSELQRVVGAAKALQRFIEYDAPEIAESMWAGYGLFIVNTAGRSKEEAENMLKTLVSNIKPGAFNAIAARKDDVEFRTLDLEPKVNDLVQLIDAYERLIIGNSTVPSALLGREEDQNMATLKGKIEFFMNGAIRAERESIVREVSRQWYQRLVERIEPTALNEVSVGAEFEPFIVSNWVDMVDAVSKLKSLIPEMSTDAILTILGLEYLKNDIRKTF
ncbi:MAG: hypothetical protein QXI92_01500 [Candidatus Nitrosocaldus sp.]